MSTLTATRSARQPGMIARNHFLLRRLHSFTGIFFGLFVCFHLTVNSTLIEGRTYGEGEGVAVFQGLVNYIHSIPFVWAVSLGLIILPIVYHTLYGFYIIYTGQPNVGSYGYTRNWLYIMQRVTAVILTLFIAFHVLGMKGAFGDVMKFDHHYAVASTVQHLTAGWWVGWVIYPIGVLAAAAHTANGFWAAGVTWGLTISKSAQNRWAGVCVLIFVGLFGAGMTALLGALTKQ